MVDKTELQLKELRDKIYELEDEMSVSTRNNIYADDIRKSKRLLLYRYALLLQIKDIRKDRRKIETRIDRINTLKSLGARGRILTNRESQAIKDVHKDIRKREDIVEVYDNKKEVYSDKRLAYYGFDEDLIEIFYKHVSEFEPFFDVTEKNVLELKEQLDLGHNYKENMSNEEILVANEERYGDEIVDFELGITFDVTIPADVIDLSNTNEDAKIKESNLEVNEDKLVSEEDAVLAKLLKLENELLDDSEHDSGVPKYNYNNGYNLYTEQMEKIVLDSIDDEIANDIASEVKNYSLESKELLEQDFTEDKTKKHDFLDETNKNIANNIESKKIILEDKDIFAKSGNKAKTDKLIKEKVLLKEKLEEYINTKGNDMTREFYNNEIRNTDLDNQEIIDDLDKKLNLDIYELGILYEIDKKIKELKNNNDDSDDYTIKVLINKLYQIKMQYKLFPGFCFDDVNEYEPERIVDLIKKFDENNTEIDVQEIYRAAIGLTISCSEVKERYRKMYGLDRNTVSEVSNTFDNKEEKEME